MRGRRNKMTKQTKTTKQKKIYIEIQIIFDAGVMHLHELSLLSPVLQYSRNKVHEYSG
jgi:hypothetical protein